MSNLYLRKYLLIPLAALAVGAAGCSSVQPSPASLAQAQLAIRDADQRKASQYAPLELRKARDKFAEAEQARSREEYIKANRLAEEALVDARLAEVMAESAMSRESAAELQKSIKTLRDETERSLKR